MKSKLIAILTLVTAMAGAQGFLNVPGNWGTPNGGLIKGGVTYGYNTTDWSAFSGDDTGSQTWSLQDMNGDNKPDLLVCAQLQGGKVTCFAPGASQYWKVYLNTGTSFSSSPVTWSLPAGGKIDGSISYGFDNINGFANTSHNTGSQSWSLVDMNNDNKVDLVVTSQLQGGNVTCFAPGTGQYWKVYKNTGTGFATAPDNWILPAGGKLTGGTSYGFDLTSGYASNSDNTGAQSWSMADMDGDGKPDLVITAQLQAGNVTSFSPGPSQYWKVYLNNGTSFVTTPVNWSLPAGGSLKSSINYGFNGSSGAATANEDAGSQTWRVVDLNGDKKPDLLVSAQLQAGKVTCFSPGASQYWKVYVNTGSGFSTSPLNWDLPNGGYITNNITYGFTSSAGGSSSADNTGSQSWSVADLDNDGRPDLVVTAQVQGGNATCFSPSASPYWKVYHNQATKFEAVPVNWLLPTGGKLSGGIAYGFDQLFGMAFTSDNTGSQSWSVMDINGDGKADLVVTGQLQGGNVTSFSPSSSQYWKTFTGDGILGVSSNDYNAGTRLSVFPNPSSGKFMIKSSSEGWATVYNDIGQKVLTAELNAANNFSAQVKVPESGVYFVHQAASVFKVIVIE
jgi:uncharacterized membrane protein